MDLENTELDPSLVPETEPLEDSSQGGDLSQEDQTGDNVSEGESKQPEKNPPKDSLLRALKKQKYNLLDQNQKIKEENEALRVELQKTIESGTVAYGKNVYNDLQRAMERKRLALEEGDSEALIEADREVSRADRAVVELEQYLESHSFEAEEKSSSSEAKAEIPLSKQEAALDFIRENPDLDPSSKQYNPRKAEEVANFISYVNEELKKEGRADEIMTDSYFIGIEKYAVDLDRNLSKKTQNTSQNSNQSYKNNVAGVRNGGAVGGTEAKYRNVTLTATERRNAKVFNMTEEEYLKGKIEGMKNGQIKQSR